MISIVQSIKQKAQIPNTTYLRILQRYNFSGEEMHFVFEGNEDQSFYFNFLQEKECQYVTHISHGKSNSLAVYQKLDWSKYNKERVLFFIDQDYCRLLNKAIPTDYNIYETTFYSIENYLPTSLLLRRLVNEILHFTEADQLDEIVDVFEREVQNFAVLMKPIIVWILVCRENNLKVNLKGINLGKVFEVSSNLKVVKKSTNVIKYLEKATGIKTPVGFYSQVKKWHLTISTQASYKVYLRGKFELWFLLEFFKETNHFLLSEYNHKSGQSTNINCTNAIEILGPRVRIPSKLKNFLTDLEFFV